MKKYCIDCKKIISKTSKRCKSCSNKFRKGYKWNENSKKRRKGENNPAWKGNKVGYLGLHVWLRKNKPKSEFCEKCGQKKKLTIANINGNYSRDFKNFIWLCYTCHNKFDKEMPKCG